MGFGIGVSNPGMGPRGTLGKFAAGQDARGQIFNPRVVLRLLAYLRPYLRQMALAFVAMLAVSALTLLTPYLLKVAVDQYIYARRPAWACARLAANRRSVCRSLHHRTPGCSTFSRGSGSGCWRTCAALYSVTCSSFPSATTTPTSSV